MKFTVSNAFVATMLVATTAGAAVDVPSHHPNVAVLAKFSPHFRCPYANEWVNKGPVQAAVDLGLWNATSTNAASSSSSHSVRRRTQEEAVAGSCVYTNVWTGQSACVELRGDQWTSESMQARCDTEQMGSLTASAGCELPPSMAGWCIATTDTGAVEASPLPVGGGMDCDQVKMTCETLVGGSFEASESCMEGGAPAAPEGEIPEGMEAFPIATPSGGGDGPINCAIAPGAIGAGHQAAYSGGYSPVCEGTPAEGSPYMWPMGWTANVESESMAYGSDEIVYNSIGKVHYRLDKNWKRQDWWYTRGVQRGLGQSPCAPEDVDQEQTEGPILACRRNSDEYTTMIHRGSKMMFISWKNDTEVGSSDPNQIEKCDWLDLQIIGNIRPDWYMDDRGDSTDVQYLGDQHVFHRGAPRLVKQWRKKDFASQYFTMSMLANPKEDGVHWPMILNVPGEGFGDDFLQVYSNHSLLTDDDDNLFLLDEALEAIGGMCETMGNGGGGPPATGEDQPHIPSNLEVDPNAWFSNVYTYSPVWEPPMKEEANMTAAESGRAITEQGSVVVSSCYDSSAQAVELSVEFIGVQETDGSELPWMALGYRETAECRMNPQDGSASEMILLTSAEQGDVEAYYAMLPSSARSFNADAVTSISESLVPLDEKEGYSSVDLHLPSTTTAFARSGAEDSVVLHFKQSMEEAPEVMHLMYAIGSSPQVGYHLSRECFDITEFPTCPTSTESSEATTTSHNVEGQAASSGRSSSFALVAGIICVASTLSTFIL